MQAMYLDEDTPETRRARIEAHLRAKYPERFPQSESVDLGADSPQPGAGAPPSSDSDRIRALLERYKAAGDDSEVRDAEGKAKTARVASLFGDAFSTLATSAGRARGYQSDSGGYWNRLAGLHDPDVAAAKQRMKDRQAGILQEDQFEQAGVARDRASSDFARKQALQGREDADYVRSQGQMKAEDDPNSTVSKLWQRLASQRDPEGDYSGKSATEIKGLNAPQGEMFRIREQSDAKRAAAESQRLAIEASARERAAARAEAREERAFARGESRAAEDRRRQDALAKEARDRAYDQEKLSAPKPLGSEEKKRLDNADMAVQAVEDMSVALDKGDNTFSVVGDNNFTEARRRFQEAFGRLQSGGAIGKDEEARFAKMAPTMGDTKEMQQRKLQQMRDELNRIRSRMGQGPAPGSSEGGAGGVQVYGRGSIPEAD